jgi:integrase/recombinase XerD
METTISAPLADLADAFLEAQKTLVSAQGFTTLRGLTFRMLAWFDEEELDPCTLGIQEAVRYEAFLAGHARGDGVPICAGTMQNYLKTARRFFAYLVNTERRSTNPFTELRYPRLEQHLSRNVLSEAQMGRLLAALARFDACSPWWQRLRRYRVHVIAEFLYATGLRIAEAASLVPAALDLGQRLVRLEAGKGGKPRTAYLSGYASDILAHYLATGRDLIRKGYERDSPDTLFMATKGRLAIMMNAELRGVCTELELPVITTHGFRHSLGTHLLRAGCDMRHIQVILGHEALSTTQIYTRVDKDDLKRSLDAFHPRKWRRASQEVSHAS